jgi:hypothetical protein
MQQVLLVVQQEQKLPLAHSVMVQMQALPP